MGSSAVLDLEPLVAPIAGAVPAGIDLRQDLSSAPVYYEIKDARTAARAAERQGEFGPVIGAAEAAAWRPIVASATVALAQHTKDLEIVAWLIEALVRTGGYAGFRDGCKLARELVERYWDGLYPSPDEEGVATRVGPLTGLNGAGAEGTLVAPIARIALTGGSSVEPVSAWTCRQALDLERLPQKVREERVQAGAISMETVQTAVRETQPAFFVALLADIDGAEQELVALGAALDARCGRDAPPTSALLETVRGAGELVRNIARDVLPKEIAPAVVDADGATAASGAASGGPGGMPSGIGSRDDAFRLLTLVADYFRRAEPHTPISFLLDRAIRWGRLPLPDLLGELIPDDGARATFAQLTGVEFPKPA